MKKFTYFILMSVFIILTGLQSKANSVVDFVVNSENHEKLEAAVIKAGLVEALQAEGPFTVFAPTNDAFAALLNELGAASLNDVDAATLEAVLKMHVIEGNVMSSDLTEGLTAPTLLGEDLMFSLENGAKIMDPNGRVSNIIDVDYEAQNGVVHVVDTVILPDLRPETVVDIATSNDAFSIWWLRLPVKI